MILEWPCYMLSIRVEKRHDMWYCAEVEFGHLTCRSGWMPLVPSRDLWRRQTHHST